MSDWDTYFVDWSHPGNMMTAANPAPSTMNPSPKCGRLMTTTSEWDLIYLDLDDAADFKAFPIYKLKVYAPLVGGRVLFKFENAANTKSSTITRTPQPGEWRQLVFDFSDAPSGVYTRMVIFYDFGETRSSYKWYFDDLVRVNASVADTEPPTTPGDIVATNVRPTSLILSWTPSTDNAGVAGYNVFRDGKFWITTTVSSVSITGLAPGRSHECAVSAFDFSGNESSAAAIAVAAAPKEDVAMGAYNLRLGVQSIGPAYHFTSESSLVETARVTRAMGSNILKIALGVNKYDDLSGSYASLRDLVENDPSFRAVLDMDFTYYLVWAYGPSNWYDGQTKSEADAEYDAIYQLTAWLLNHYDGSGKKFYLGHWEGDWHLVNDPGHEWDTFRNPLPAQRVQGMIDWLNVRQAAVDAAKQNTPHENVDVFQYTEVNLVEKSFDGYPSLTTDVLPYTDVDYVSYSSYDATTGRRSYNDVKAHLVRALDFIESRLPAKAGLPPGKRVWIGEYGYPFNSEGASNGGNPRSPEEQDAMSRNVMRVGLEWGCPFILYWEMYNNEVENNKQRGFWLIDNFGEKQPVYYTHQNYYLLARRRVADLYEQGRLPSEQEFRTLALVSLDESQNRPTLIAKSDVSQNSGAGVFPNPFNSSTRLQFFVKKIGIVKVNVYSIRGRRIRTLLDQTLEPGEHSVVWDGRNKEGEPLPSGVYFVAVRIAGGKNEMIKTTMIK